MSNVDFERLIKALADNISEQTNAMLEAHNAAHDAHSGRITKLEKLCWAALGAAIVSGAAGGASGLASVFGF